MSCSKPIRILHNVGSISAGGMEALIMNYYRHIDRSKVQFDFMVRLPEMKSKYYEKEIKELGGKLFRLPLYNTETRRFFMGELFRFLKQNPEYKIMHSHPDIVSVFYLTAAKAAGVPVRIAHSHGTSYDKNWKALVKSAAKPFLNRCCTHRFACGEQAGSWLFGNKYKNSVRILPNAIDVELFSYDIAKRSEFRAEFSLNNDFVIVNVAKFSEVKNHCFILDIFNEVSKLKKNAKLVLVGDGELKANIKEKVASLGLQEKVIFLGIRNDVDRILSGCDVFLLPSLFEGLPFVLIEAQTSGLKCIVSDAVPDDAKIIDKLYVSVPLSRSAKEWADIVLNNEKYERYSSAQAMKSHGYNIKDNAKHLEEFYINVYEKIYRGSYGE